MSCEFLVTRSSFLPSLGPWLRGLLSDSTLADVSLACGDLVLLLIPHPSRPTPRHPPQVAPAHRVVLASSSRVFSRMLRAAPASTHTVIHLQVQQLGLYGHVDTKVPLIWARCVL